MRRTDILLVAVFLMQFGGAVGTTGVPLLAKFEFNATLFELALIGMTGTLTYTVTCLAIGWVAGRFRPFTFALSGAAGYALTYLLALLATQNWHLMVVFAGGGFSAALFWPMTEAILAEGAVGHRLNRRIGLFNISWSMADAAGAVTGGLLFHLWHRLPLLALSAAMIGVTAATLLARRRPVDGEERLPRRFCREMLAAHEAREVNARFRKGAWVANFVGAGVMNVVRSVFAGPAKDIFLMSPAMIGAAIGTFNAFRTLTFWLLREWPDWHYRPRIFLCFNSLVAGAMAGVVGAALVGGTAGVGIVFLSFAALGVGVGMTYYSSIFYAVDTEAMAASTTRLHEAVLGGGGAAAVLAAGILDKVATGSVNGTLSGLSPFIMCGGAVALGMVLTGRHIMTARSRNILEVGGEGSYSGPVGTAGAPEDAA